MTTSRVAFCLLLLLACGAAACAPEAGGTTPPPPSAVALAPRPTPEAQPALPDTATPEPSATETIRPTATSTPTTSPTATQTSTPLPTAAIGGCAEIFKPGYYRLSGDVNNPPSTRIDCFFIQSHNVVLDCDNHKVTGRSLTGYAIRIRQFNFPLLETPNNIEIKNCKITNFRTAIVAEAGINLYIHDNDLSHNYDDTNPQRYGIFLGSTEAGGIRFDGVHGARIENNQANDQAIGFDIRNSDHVTIKGNTASRNSAWGVSFINTTNSEISGNTANDNVRSCTWGDNKTVGRGCDAGAIFLQDGASHNVIKDNSVSGDNGNGIFIKAHGFKCGDDNLIQGNKINGALYNAIEFSFCKDNRIIGNEISGSLDAIFFGFTENTQVRNNTIKDMRNHGIIAWNTHNSVVDGNQVANSREGIFFYWDLWDPKQFAFLPPSPDKYASRDNVITNNMLKENARAGIHLTNTTRTRVDSNQFSYNPVKDILVDGAADGNVIPNPQSPPTGGSGTQAPAASPTP